MNRNRKTLRNALRKALDSANRTGDECAHEIFRDGSLGVYGHIHAALKLMGEDEALAHFFDSGEWPSDKGVK